MLIIRFNRRPDGEYSIIDAYRDMLRAKTHCEKRVQIRMLKLDFAIGKYWALVIRHLN